MSFLGGRLELAEGARLTAIGLTPYSREAIDPDARGVMHGIRFDGDIEAVAAAEVLAVFVPAAIATLAGTEPDGGAWGAVIQYVPESDVSPAHSVHGSGGKGRGLECVRLDDRPALSVRVERGPRRRSCTRNKSRGPDGEQHPRAERLRVLLRDWSATYEGPRA